MIVLVGDSGSGKSSIACCLYEYKKRVAYTSRPMRSNEVEGSDYNFKTKQQFEELIKKGFFGEHSIYNGWHYGTAKSDCTDDKIIVINPHGLRQLKKMTELNIISFYIKVSECERIIRLATRGDSTMELFRRVISDQGNFIGIEDEVDYVVENNDIAITINEIREILSENEI